MQPDATAPLVALREIWKIFESVPVLKGLDFEIRSGQVHALLGGNGSGKSTLVKIISGAYIPTEGVIEIAGTRTTFNRPSDAHRMGIYMVPQEPHIFPNLTVLENLTMGLDGNTTDVRGDAKRIATEIGLAVDFSALGGELSIANQQLVEIARGLLRKARVLILDEPTSSLTRQEVNSLAREMRALTDKGIGILFISHRLDEVLEFSDKVSVLRDGKVILSESAASLSSERLVEAMLPSGFVVTEGSRHAASAIGTPVLVVRNLSGRTFSNVSFEVLAGEVVGLAGVVGSGRTELAQAIYGIDNDVTGDVAVAGINLINRSPASSHEAGLTYVPEDRHAHGVFLSLPCAQTVSSSLMALSRGTFMSRTHEHELTQSFTEKLRIKLSSPAQIARTLSGGNQQKIVLAKTLAPNPRVIILDEPTRGIDARARQDVYRIIRNLTNDGVAVVVISSEMGEIAEVSDRVLVMHRGRIRELPGGRQSVEQISAATFAHTGSAAA